MKIRSKLITVLIILLAVLIGLFFIPNYLDYLNSKNQEPILCEVESDCDDYDCGIPKNSTCEGSPRCNPDNTCGCLIMCD